jgi:hypothetical protein
MLVVECWKFSETSDHARDERGKCIGGKAPLPSDARLVRLPKARPLFPLDMYFEKALCFLLIELLVTTLLLDAVSVSVVVFIDASRNV